MSERRITRNRTVFFRAFESRMPLGKNSRSYSIGRCGVRVCPTLQKAWSRRSRLEALGALLIKEILGLNDREVVESVIENPYLQYFIGFKSSQMKITFSASLQTHSRKRLPIEVVMSLNKKVIGLAKKNPAVRKMIPSQTEVEFRQRIQV